MRISWRVYASAAIVVVCLAAVATLAPHAANSAKPTTTPNRSAATSTQRPLRADGSPVPISLGNMLGKSLDEIGERVRQDALARGDVESGMPEIKLVRIIKRTDLPALGLGCPMAGLTIEEPPLALVILKGNMQPNWPGPIMTRESRIFPYIAYVFDLWAGQIGLSSASIDAGHFKKALNDASLPDPVVPTPDVTSCTEYEGAPLFHYGDTIPGTTPMPEPGARLAPTPTGFVDPPNPTFSAPIATTTK